jgi:glycosyltransferase involved in cell wall biosynthesis
MAGPAIRAWELSRQLCGDNEVVLATLAACDRDGEGFRTVPAGHRNLPGLVDWCDVVVFQGYLLLHYPWIAERDRVLVADIYDPFHLESLEWERFSPDDVRWASLTTSVEVLNEQLRRADYLLCASERQRSFWLGQLSGVGRVNPATYDADESLRGLLDVVPFGVPAEPARRRGPGVRGVVDGIAPGDRVLLWGGGVYNWFDPLTLIEAVAQLASTRPDLRLVFLGMKHPTEGIPEMRMALQARERAASLDLVGRHVFFNESWVPYERRADFLLDADVGVSCHLDHVETEFSFRTRILDYLWAGLPVVCTAGDSFGDLVEIEGLGATAPAGDVTRLAAALDLVLDDETGRRCRENVVRVRERFVWDRAAAPLVEFCRQPRSAPDYDRREGGRGGDAAAPSPPPAVDEGPVGARMRRDASLLREYLRREGVGGTTRRVRGRIARWIAP